MNITIGQAAFAEMLIKAAAISNQKSPLPSASRLLLTTEGDSVRVCSANESISLVGTVAADVTSPGSVCVNARDLLDRVRAMPAAPVTLTTKDDGVRITAKGSKLKYTIHTSDVDNYPAPYEPPRDARWVNVAGSLVAKLVAGVKFSVSVDTTRAHLNSMMFELDGENARGCSTDGHRLTNVEVPCGGRVTALLPLASLSEVVRVCEGATGDVDVYADERMAFFRVPGALLGVRLPEAVFPTYRQVIPSGRDAASSFTVAREPFMRSLRAVALAGKSDGSDKSYAGVKLDVRADKIVISAQSADAGDSEDEIAIDFAGKPLKFGMSARYLLDWLGSVDGENVTMSVGDELDPVVLTHGESVGVIMPARV